MPERPRSDILYQARNVSGMYDDEVVAERKCVQRRVPLQCFRPRAGDRYAGNRAAQRGASESGFEVFIVNEMEELLWRADI